MGNRGNNTRKTIVFSDFCKKITMKKYVFGFLAVALLVSSCFDPTKKEVLVGYSEYGTHSVDIAKAIPIDAMVADFKANANERKAYTVTAEIEEVCAKAGCWINIKQKNGAEMMVRFKDHFTIPTDTKLGTQAFLHGDLFVDTISVDMLRHFAEDAGKTPEEIEKITEAKINMGFEADGIKFLPAKK